MNCPFHILIYKDSLKSYRDLPVRLGELGTVYRYERSGVMHGLLRVRGFTQDDAHIFCMPEQIEGEIAGLPRVCLDVLKDFGFDKFQTELSTWNPERPRNFVGSDEQWNMATQFAGKSAQEAANIEYKTIPGEAAFYGPKIDIKLVDAIGRLWQLSTVQFDFNLPQRFGLEYVAEDGSRKQPVMVHRALYGSVERFFGVLIEHYAGAFPGVALAGAGGDDSDQRAARGVREQSCAQLKARRARGSRCAQRKDECQDPRACHAEGAVPAGRRR
jgi:threonyl-tRNA synthetase